MIRLVTLFSGSKGNCTLIQGDNANILIDAGCSYGRIVKELSALSLTPCDIHGIVITHEHRDHTSALPKWCSDNNTPIYVHGQLLAVMFDMCCGRAVSYESQFVIGDITVTPLICSHDAIYCNGYMFSDNSCSVASITDTGYVCDSTMKYLTQCRTVLLESNHDTDMVHRGSYSYKLKQRILSTHGHLSNAQAGEIICKLLEGNVVNIVLGHLSENNNTHELAFASAMNAIVSSGKVEGRDVHLYISHQRTRGEIIE